MYDSIKIGRITGLLYVVVIVCAGFSQGVVRESVYVAGEAAQTAQNILENEFLFRWGLITDLIAFSADVAISMLLYYLLKSENKPLAMIMASFRLIAHPGVATVNLINHFAALKVLQFEGWADGIGQDQIFQFSQFFMEAHHFGYLLAGVTFGFHCLLLGILFFKSNAFPNLLGILMVGASFGYLIESFGFILYPEYKSIFAIIVGSTAAVGEVSLAFWMLVKGAKSR